MRPAGSKRVPFYIGWTKPDHSSSGIGFTRQGSDGEGDTGALLKDTAGEGHHLVVGPTGSGKSASYAIPQLLGDARCVVAIDVKGELYHVTNRYRRTLGPVCVIDPFRLVSDGEGAINPVELLCSDDPGFIDDVYALAVLFANQIAAGGKDGPFWENWATDVWAGLIAHVASSKHEGSATFGEAHTLLQPSDVIYELAVLLDTKAKHPLTQANIGRFLALPEVTRGGILATVTQQTRLLASSAVRASLAGNTLPLNGLRDGKPFTIYIVLPPDKLNSHAALIRVYLSALVTLFMRRPNRPQYPTLFLVDEAAQLGRVPALVAGTTLGRGYGIRVAWMVQSLGQLAHTYPNEHDTILENCSVLTFGKHPSYSMSKTLAERAFGDVNADAVFDLGRDELMVRLSGLSTVTGRKLDYRRDAMFRGRFDPNPLYEPPGPDREHAHSRER